MVSFSRYFTVCITYQPSFVEMKCTETKETLIVVTEMFGRSPLSEATKNTHNVSKVGLTLSSSGTGKGENLKHLVYNQKGMHYESYLE